jgi:hypothetical protein
MQPNSQRESDFILSDGAFLNIKINNDVNGTPVISSLHIFFPNKRRIPSGGITASTFRNIRFEDLFIEYFRREKEIDQSPYERKEIIKYLRNVSLPSGRTAYPPEYYAAISFLYLDQFKLTPMDPTSQLASLLNLPKRTVVNRLATARKLGLLSQNSPHGPSGRAGGSLTDKGLKALGAILKI